MYHMYSMPQPMLQPIPQQTYQDTSKEHNYPKNYSEHTDVSKYTDSDFVPVISSQYLSIICKNIKISLYCRIINISNINAI